MQGDEVMSLVSHDLRETHVGIGACGRVTAFHRIGTSGHVHDKTKDCFGIMMHQAHQLEVVFKGLPGMLYPESLVKPLDWKFKVGDDVECEDLAFGSVTRRVAGKVTEIEDGTVIIDGESGTFAFDVVSCNRELTFLPVRTSKAETEYPQWRCNGVPVHTEDLEAVEQLINELQQYSSSAVGTRADRKKALRAAEELAEAQFNDVWDDIQAVKASGNELFKADQFDEAIVKYGAALELLECFDVDVLRSISDALKPAEKTRVVETRAALFGNAAACHLKSRRWNPAMKEARKALALSAKGSDVARKAQRRLEKAEAGLRAFDARDLSALRFQPGARVKCSVVGGFKLGIVWKCWHQESEHKDAGVYVPYQIQMDDGELLYASHDTDKYIHLAPTVPKPRGEAESRSQAYMEKLCRAIAAHNLAGQTSGPLSARLKSIALINAIFDVFHFYPPKTMAKGKGAWFTIAEDLMKDHVGKPVRTGYVSFGAASHQCAGTVHAVAHAVDNTVRVGGENPKGEPDFREPDFRVHFGELFGIISISAADVLPTDMVSACWSHAGTSIDRPLSTWGEQDMLATVPVLKYMMENEPIIRSNQMIESVKSTDPDRWRVCAAYADACAILADLLHGGMATEEWTKGMYAFLCTRVATCLQEECARFGADAYEKRFEKSKAFAETAFNWASDSPKLTGDALLALAGAQKGLGEFGKARVLYLQLQSADPLRKKLVTTEIKKLKKEEEKALRKHARSERDARATLVGTLVGTDIRARDVQMAEKEAHGMACAQCDLTKPKDAYSQTQWKKSAGVGRCRDCVQAVPPSSSPKSPGRVGTHAVTGTTELGVPTLGTGLVPAAGPVNAESEPVRSGREASLADPGPGNFQDANASEPELEPAAEPEAQSPDISSMSREDHIMLLIQDINVLEPVSEEPATEELGADVHVNTGQLPLPVAHDKAAGTATGSLEPACEEGADELNFDDLPFEFEIKKEVTFRLSALDVVMKYQFIRLHMAA